MTNTPPTPEKPSPEALAAARTVLPEGMTLIAVLERKLREDFALALDRFAAARVEAERERCAAIFAHYQSPRLGIVRARNSGEIFAEIEGHIRSGEQP